MKKKENILKKIHLKDYTNGLEKVLEKKGYSLQTKNLLLSMLYKIENAYADYAKTKVEVYDKRDFLEDLIQIIEEDCKEIEITKINQEEQMLNNYTIDKEQGTITTIGNDLNLLNAILEIEQKTICFPQEEELIQNPISYILNLGNRMHEAEVIRDFNGWSWDILTKEITNIEINLVFQNYLYLLGHEFITQWIQNDSELVDHLMLASEKLKKEFGEERGKKLAYLLCKLAIEITSANDKEQIKMWKKLVKEENEELKKITNKKIYLDEVTKKKKEITKQIEEIDKMLNNKQLLQKEYEQRNEKLPNKEKIFSIRHLVTRLEVERQEYVNEIKKCNSLIDPKGFIARKEELCKRVEFLNTLNLNTKQDRKETLIDLCLTFLDCFQIKISKAQTKQEIISYFYILRYYRFLPFDKEQKLKDIASLEEKFENTIRILLEKAYKLSIIETITDEPDINYQIIRKLFDSKMIDLNHTIIETKVEDGKLLAQYYDTNILESTYQIQSSKTVKLKKKVKLFV